MGLRCATFIVNGFRRPNEPALAYLGNAFIIAYATVWYSQNDALPPYDQMGTSIKTGIQKHTKCIIRTAYILRPDARCGSVL